VLFPGLQRQPVRGRAFRIDGHPDEPTWQTALEAGPHRDEAGMRSAVSEGHAESLGGSDRHIGALLAGRLEQREGQQVSGHGNKGAAGVGGIDDRP